MDTQTRIIVVGSGGVGKSSLITRHIHGHFVSDYDPTIEDFYTTNMTIDGEDIPLNILDTAGQEDYSALRDVAMQFCDGVMICYSVDCRYSFRELDSFRQSILRVKGVSNFPTVLVATKSDLDAREVLDVEGRDWARGHSIPFLISSAKEDQGVNEAFEALVRLIKTFSVESEDVVRRQKHSDAVWKCRINKGMLISASRDHTAKLWNLASGELQQTFVGHTGRLYDVCIVGEGIFTASADGDIRQYDVLSHYSTPTSVSRVTLKGHTDAITCLEYDDVSNTLWSGSLDETVRGWQQGSEVRLFSGCGQVQCMVLTRGLVIVGCGDNNGYVFSTGRPLEDPNGISILLSAFGLETGETKVGLLHTLEGHTGPIYHMTKCDRLVFTGSADTTVRSWDCLTGRSVGVYAGHGDWVNSLQVHGRHLYTGSRDCTVRCWDIVSGDVLHVFLGHEQSVRTLAVDDDGLYTAGKDASVRMWGKDTGELLWQFEGQHDRTTAYINDVCLGCDENGKKVVVSAGTDGILVSHDIAHRKLARVFSDRNESRRMEMAPVVTLYASVVLFLVEILQMMSFVFTGAMTSTWSSFNPLLYLGSVVQLSIPISTPTLFATIYAICASFALLFVLGFVCARYIWNRGTILWNIDRLIASVCSRVLFIPIMRIFLRVFDCTVPLVCWSASHISLVVVTAILCVPFLILALRLSRVGGDMDRQVTAFYFLLSWKHDRPDTRRRHLFSRRSTSAELKLKILQLILVVLTQYLHRNTLVICLLVVFIMVVLSIPLSPKPPYYDIGVNTLNFALNACVVWTCVMAIVAVFGDLVEPYITLVLFLGYPAVFTLAWYSVKHRFTALASEWDILYEPKLDRRTDVSLTSVVTSQPNNAAKKAQKESWQRILASLRATREEMEQLGDSEALAVVLDAQQQAIDGVLEAID